MSEPVPAPYSDLHDRLQGRQTLWTLETVPGPATASLLYGWLAEIFSDYPEIYERICMQRRVAASARPRETVAELIPSASDAYRIIDHALQLMKQDDEMSWGGKYKLHTEYLDKLLLNCGSAYRLDSEDLLEWRILPEVVEAHEEARQAAEAFGVPSASARLASAWRLAYSLNPNPSESVAESIRAVEAVAIPVVIPKQHEPQLWHAFGNLKSQKHLWRLTLAGKGGDDSIDPVVEMLGRLAGAHSDRHETASAVPVSLASIFRDLAARDGQRGARPAVRSTLA